MTSGAGSALTLATAAFMAEDNDDFIEQLPDTSGMKNEILTCLNTDGFKNIKEVVGKEV